jgi:hypothetical protein
MVDFVSHPLGVDLRSAFITFKPLWILMMKPIRRFASQGQNGNVGLQLLVAVLGRLFLWGAEAMES